MSNIADVRFFPNSDFIWQNSDATNAIDPLSDYIAKMNEEEKERLQKEEEKKATAKANNKIIEGNNAIIIEEKEIKNETEQIQEDVNSLLS